MDLLLFAIAFIVMFVGHRIGDYLLQTDWQAQNKAINTYARLKHVIVYSLTISLLLIPFFSWYTALIVFLLTMIEHFIIDSRKPIVWWKTFLETKVAKQKDFNIKSLPFFVMIEIDQTVHYIRIFIIAVLIGCGVI
ncbi:DUF3307 domain-containing protein [Halalkalibacter oceani]|uniref:DUF3307 domain-containing protein n=1 Tax=Halalkalibacter oceani TaxID=1653776 RepID=UPI003391A556